MKRRNIYLLIMAGVFVVAGPGAIAQIQEFTGGPSVGSGLAQFHEYTHVVASSNQRNVQQADAANCVDGEAAGYACDGVDLLGHIPVEDLPLSFVNDIWGWTSDAGTDYAIMGGTEGTVFVDLSDPRDPVNVGFLPAQDPGPRGCRSGVTSRCTTTTPSSCPSRLTTACRSST